MEYVLFFWSVGNPRRELTIPTSTHKMVEISLLQRRTFFDLTFMPSNDYDEDDEEDDSDNDDNLMTMMTKRTIIIQKQSVLFMCDLLICER